MAKNKKISPDVYAFMRELIQESLNQWFKEKWVRIASDGSIAGPCGTSKNTKNPDRCLPKAKAQSLTKGQRAATAAKKKKAGAKGKQVVKNTKKATVTKEATFDDIKNLSYDDVKKTFTLRKNISRAILNFFPHEDHMVKVEYYGDYIDDEDELTVKELIQFIDKRIDDTVLLNDDIDIIPAKGNAPTLFIDAGENSFEITSLNDEEFFAETANPQDGKAAPYGSGYKKVTKEDLTNLVVGMIHELKNEAILSEKDDRCTRIAKRKYDTWPSAYASGAVVRCRRGDIWKNEK